MSRSIWSATWCNAASRRRSSAKAHIKDFATDFYLCGPDPMVKELRGTLKDLGANVENVTWEK